MKNGKKAIVFAAAAALGVSLLFTGCGRKGNKGNPDITTEITGLVQNTADVQPGGEEPAASPEPSGEVTAAPVPTAEPTGEPGTDVTPEPTGDSAVTPTPAGTNTPTKSVSTGAATPTPTKQLAPLPQTTPEPAGTSTPVQGTTKSGAMDLTIYRYNETTYEEPKDGVIRMVYYLREQPGRTGKRIVKMAIGTQVQVLYSCTNLFHEPWYRIRTTINGVEYEGYVQQSTTELGTKVTKTTMEMPLLVVPMNEEPTGTHGPDRNGDGIYVVVLDAGHGGVFSGASYYGTNEKTINLKVAQYCKAYLEANYDNVVVYMTRNGDYEFDPEDTDDDIEYRARYARDHGADILFSIHFNAYDGKGHGAMALVGKKASVHDRQVLLASYALKELRELGIPSVGIRRKESAFTKYLDGTRMDGYLLIRLCSELNIPSTIVEHCYMDSSKDRGYWNSEDKLKKLGTADATAIAKYLGLPAKGNGQAANPNTNNEQQGGTQQGGTQQGGTQQSGTQQSGTQQGNTQQGNTQQGGNQQGNTQQGGTENPSGGQSGEQGGNQQGTGEQGNTQQGGTENPSGGQSGEQGGQTGEQGGNQQGTGEQGNTQQGGTENPSGGQSGEQGGQSGEQGGNQQGSGEQGNTQQGGTENPSGSQSGEQGSQSGNQQGSGEQSGQTGSQQGSGEQGGGTPSGDPDQG